MRSFTLIDPHPDTREPRPVDTLPRHLAVLTREIEERSEAWKRATSTSMRMRFVLATMVSLVIALSASLFASAFWFYAGALAGLVAALTFGQSELRQRLERGEIARLELELQQLRNEDSAS